MSTKSATNTPDARLKKLRRLESNMACPNCGTRAQQGLGFGNVCVKFKTFVCDYCKTSHQAFSHRVKSIAMSNWTDEEVNELMDENGGGNAACLHIWLAKAPALGGRYPGGSRPREGDRIEIFKKFVQDCYDSGIFRADTSYVPGSSSTSSSAPPATTAPVRLAPAAPARPVAAAPAVPPRSAPAAQQTPAPVSNLISFDTESPFTSSSVSSQQSLTSSNLSFDGFAPFQQSFGNSNAGQTDPFAFSAAPAAPQPAPAVAPAAITAAASAPARQAPRPAAPVATSARPPKPAEVDLLSYDDVAPAPAPVKKNGESLLDLLAMDSALPAAAPPASSMRPLATPPVPPMAGLAALNGSGSGKQSPLSLTPPTNDPFGSVDLLQPSSFGNSGRQQSPMSGNSSPMMGTGGGLGMPMNGGYPGMGGMPRPMAMNPPGPMGGGPMGGGPMGGGPMGGGPMGGMRYGGGSSPMVMGGGGVGNAISALNTQQAPYRPGYAAGPPPAQDKFSYIQETMKKHLENPHTR